MPANSKLRKITTGTLTTTAGGAASGSILGVDGAIQGIYVDLGTAVTADVVVTSDLGKTILTKAAIVADTFFATREPALQNDGTTAFTNGFVEYVNSGGTITVAITNGGNVRTLTVYALYREL